MTMAKIVVKLRHATHFDSDVHCSRIRNHCNNNRFHKDTHLNDHISPSYETNNGFKPREDKGDREPYSIGNLSRVIFRIGIKLPRALRGCFVGVLHD